jgi:hypothetical protein
LKYLCSSCGRLANVAAFSVDGDELALVCARCGATTRAAAQPPAAAAVAVGAPRPEEAGADGTAPTPLASAPAAPTASQRVYLASSPVATNVVSIVNPAARAVERARASTERALEVPDTHCPKCLAPRADGPSCARCGLQATRAEPAAFAPPEWLAVAWIDALQTWGDDAVHARMLATAISTEALASLGRLYRIRLVDCPDDPWALRYLDEIRASASLPILKPLPADQPIRSYMWLRAAVSIATIVICLAILGYLLPRLRAP